MKENLFWYYEKSYKQITTWLTNQFMKGDDVKIVDIFYKKNLSKEHDKRLREINNIDLLDFVTDFPILMNINNVYKLVY